MLVIALPIYKSILNSESLWACVKDCAKRVKTCFTSSKGQEEGETQVTSDAGGAPVVAGDVLPGNTNVAHDGGIWRTVADDGQTGRLVTIGFGAAAAK